MGLWATEAFSCARSVGTCRKSILPQRTQGRAQNLPLRDLCGERFFVFLGEATRMTEWLPRKRKKSLTPDARDINLLGYTATPRG